MPNPTNTVRVTRLADGVCCVLDEADFDSKTYSLCEEAPESDDKGEDTNGDAPVPGEGEEKTEDGEELRLVDILQLNVADAGNDIYIATTEELDAYEKTERANPHHDGGRRGVLGAIEARRKALKEMEE